MEDHQTKLCRWYKRGGMGIASFLGFWFWIVAAVAQTQQGAPTITVTVNKSLIFTLPQKARRVSVTQPEVADVTVVAPNQLLINGKSVGVTSLVIWPQSGDITNYDLVVSPDVEALRRQLKTMYANEKVEVSTSGPAIVLKGEVSNEVIYDKVLEVAQTYLPPAPAGAVAPPSTAVTVTTPPVTLPPSGTAFAGGGQLAFNEEGAFDDVNRWSNRKRIPGIIDFLVIKEFRQIELDVIVAQISLTKARRLGVNFNFSSVLNSAGSTLSSTNRPGDQGLLGPITPGNASSIISLVFQRYSISTLFRLIQNRDIAEILAQPKLVVKNGRVGGFLSGGEFPLPVTSTLGTPSTIEFKPFGVRLDFLPTITLSDSIDLRVFPEVSERDNVNSVNGVPSLTVRRAVSRVEMKEGETLVLSGLVQRNVVKDVTKFPILGDVPVLGGLFRSTDFTTDEKELVIVITPKIVRPMKPGEKPEIPSLEKYDSPDMRQIPLPGSSAPEPSTRRSTPGGPTMP